MPQATYDEIWPSVAAFDARPWLAAMPWPVLGIYGGRGRYVAAEAARLLSDLELDRFGGEVRVEVVPNTGHFVNLEAPEAVNAALLDWLAGVTNGQSE